MHELQSKTSTIIPIYPKIEQTIQQRLKDNPDIEEFKVEEEELKVEETMGEPVLNPLPVRRPLKHSFIPQNLDQPSCIAYQPKA